MPSDGVMEARSYISAKDKMSGSRTEAFVFFNSKCISLSNHENMRKEVIHMLVFSDAVSQNKYCSPERTKRTLASAMSRKTHFTEPS